MVTAAHRRVVADLVSPGTVAVGRVIQFDRLIMSGIITPHIEGGDPLEGCPNIRLSAGTASVLINADRKEA